MGCRYGAIVLAAEMMSVLSLIFYGIWLCAKTNNDDMKVRVLPAATHCMLLLGHIQTLMAGCMHGMTTATLIMFTGN